MTDSLEALVARALVAEGLEIESLDAAHAAVRLPGQEAASELYFGNLRRILATTEEARHGDVVARFVRSWRAMSEPGEPDATEDRRLFPRVAAPGTLDGMAGPWAEPLADGALQLMLVVDLPDALRYVRPLDLPRWQLGLADARARALRNLSATSAPLAASVRASASASAPIRPIVIEEGDGYDASRVLIAHQWLDGARGVFALVPSRDLLILIPVWGAGTLDRSVHVALEAWSAAQRTIHRLPYPVSPNLFWRSDGLLTRVPVAEDDDGALVAHLPLAASRAILGDAPPEGA